MSDMVCHEFSELEQRAPTLRYMVEYRVLGEFGRAFLSAEEYQKFLRREQTGEIFIEKCVLVCNGHMSQNHIVEDNLFDILWADYMLRTGNRFDINMNLTKEVSK